MTFVLGAIFGVNASILTVLLALEPSRRRSASIVGAVVCAAACLGLVYFREAHS